MRKVASEPLRLPNITKLTTFLMNRTSTDLAIGIDLGTTLSCVAVFRHGKIEVIENDLGSRTTRSCVAFTKAERLFGDTAFTQTAIETANIIFGKKLEIGYFREVLIIIARCETLNWTKLQ